MDYDGINRSFRSLVDNLARRLAPVNYRDMLALATELWLECPTYRQAIIRGTSLFMSELEITAEEGVDSAMDEMRAARKLVNERFETTEQPLQALQEAAGFGGSCAMLHMPIVRNLSHSCGYSSPLEHAMRDHGVAYDMEDGEYKGTCPSCRKKTEFVVTDVREKDRAKRAKLRRIPLALCDMNFNPVTGERELYFNCADWDMFAKGVRSGDPLFHRATAGVFIESARSRKPIRLSDKYFHYIGFDDVTLVDMHLDGWSLPPFFYVLNDVVTVLLLQKYNQTILGDYMVPHRYLSPPPTVGAARHIAGDSQPFDVTHASTGSYRNFASQVGSVVRVMRQNPEKIGVMPYPVQFNYMGIDSKNLLAPELLDHHSDVLMRNMGIAPEFYRGGMQAQVATPMAYAWVLYLKFWKPLIGAVQRLGQWVTDRVCEEMHWSNMTVSMVPPMLTASHDSLPYMMQMKDAGELSRETLSRVIGVNKDYEKRAVLREMREAEDEMNDEGRKSQQKQVVTQMIEDAGPTVRAMQQAQMDAQGMAPGGAPAMPGMPVGGAPAPMAPQGAFPQPGVPSAPDGAVTAGVNPAEIAAMQSVQAKAEQVAAQLFQTYPNTAHRGAALREFQAQQPLFAMFVSEAIQRIESDAQKQGLEMARGGGM